MAATMEYKCPCCGGAIAFDSTLQKMKCPYCDTEFDMETLKAYDQQLEGEGSDELNWNMDNATLSESETEGIQVYVCQSCGGEIVADANTSATSCPFCGNPVVLKQQFAGDLRPDLVLPFKKDKEAAKAAWLRHLKGKKLLPRVFRQQSHIEEIRGVYVPFWIFDASADATIRYKATQVRTWSDSKYNYTETSFYSLLREGGVAFAAIPVDGSKQLDDTLMQSIEPFDVSAAVEFQTAYLAGYLANRYDEKQDECIDRANARVRKSTAEVFDSTVTGYASAIPENTSIRLSNGRARYVLLPVWFLNTNWNGKKYAFAMNGQTGAFAGDDLPLDRGAYWKYFGMVSGIAAAVIFAVECLMKIL